jgi:glutamate formiminotransferase/formiminotetrahydrofolate cyclodeaminase
MLRCRQRRVIGDWESKQMRLVECVPNFSEGQNQKVIDAIAEAISAVEGVRLLDVDPGKSTNRTVFTFVGEPLQASEAAFQAIGRAASLIDMRQHKGEHPRMGATDVCPFIPIAGLSMEDCAELARKLGRRVGEELGIPIYLYAEAAATAARRNLADIRQGEYEALADRMKNGFTPDFGPHEFNAAAGATVIGARPFLIAYNVNINSKSKKLANEIALNIREQGRAKRDDAGNIVKDASGQTIKVDGKLKACKAVGWYVDEYARAQISINLVDYKQTSIEHAFDECSRQAESLGMRVTGSEVVGMLPLEPMLQAGRHYLEKQGRCAGVPEAELIHSAIISLGLSECSEFDPQKKIIEYAIADRGKLLRKMTICEFADELSSDSPAPGGGSVAALCGSLSASLSSMVANLTHGKKGFEPVFDLMNDTAKKAQALKDKFLLAIDEDTAAFNLIKAAQQMPKDSQENKERRLEAIEAAQKEATLVPLRVLSLTLEALDLAQLVAEKGNPNTLSDAGVAALTARAAGDAALYNVLINLPGVADLDFVRGTKLQALELGNTMRSRADGLHELVLKSLSAG